MQRALFILGLSLVWNFLSLAGAYAHGRIPGGKQVVFHPTNPDVIAVESTFGTVVTRNGGETWEYICVGVMGSTLEEDQTITLMEDGSIVAANDSGVHRGTMNGCDWDVPQRELETLAPDQTLVRMSGSSTRVLRAEGTTPEEIWRTDDNGKTWEQEGTGIEPAAFSSHSIAVAPSDKDRIYVGGAMPTGHGKVFRSTDGGKSWTGFDVSVEDGGVWPVRDADRWVQVMAVHPSDPDHLFVRAKHDEGEKGEGYHPSALDRLLRSTDGGETWTEVKQFRVLRDLAWSDDGETLWAGSTDIKSKEDQNWPEADALWRSTDGGQTFERVSDIEIECLAYHDGALWACSNGFTQFGLGRSTDGGESFEPVFELSEICGLLECPMGANVHSCRGRTLADARDDINPEDAGAPPIWATAPACEAHGETGPPSDSGPSSEAGPASEAGASADEVRGGGGCSCTVGRSALPDRLLAPLWLTLFLLPPRRRRGRRSA